MKLSKTIYSIIIILLLATIPFVLSEIDWSLGWFLPIALLSLTLLLGWAIINFENLFLFLLVIIPTLYYFNNIKINVLQFVPALNEYSLYLNPVSVIYLLIILFGAIALVEKRKELKNLPLKYIILCASLFSGASIIWSIDKSTSAIEIVYLLVPFAMYFISYSYFSKKEGFLKVIIASILSSIIPLIFAFKQLAVGEYFYESDSSLGRIMSTMAHPNSYGLYLVVILGLLITIYFAKENKKIMQNKLLIFFSLLTAVAFLLTYSRTSWACFFLFILVLIFIEKRIMMLIGLVAPVILVLFLAIENLRYRILELFNNAVFNSITARLNIWKVAFEKFQEQPLIGYGIGASETVIENAKDWKGGVSLPHNDYLLQSLELGLVGLIFYLIYTLGSIYYAITTYLKISDGYIEVKIWNNSLKINFKILTFGVLAILIALLPATIFESLSQKILIQIMIWPILGSLFSLRSTN